MPDSIEIAAKVEYRELDCNPNYRVGTDGSVWSKAKRGPGAAPEANWRRLRSIGSITIGLWDGTRKRFEVGLLVLKAFKGEVHKKRNVKHLNGDKSDNRLENLEWCTHSDLLRQNRKETVGEARIGSKLKSEQVLEIRRKLAEENQTLTNLATDYGVDVGTILAIRDRRTWRHI